MINLESVVDPVELSDHDREELIGLVVAAHVENEEASYREWLEGRDNEQLLKEAIKQGVEWPIE
jgi:hypothetical protein